MITIGYMFIACLAAACLMTEKNLDLLTALSQCCEKRGVIVQNEGFQEQLLRFSKDRGLWKDAAVTESDM